MKKIKFLLLALAMLIIIPFNTQAASKEPITVHIFRGEGCGYCAAALEFFKSIEEDYGDYFKLEEHEVWNDTDNASLMTDVASYFGEEVNGVPYIIIGEKTFQGYTESYNDQIKTEIKNAYESDEFVDIVAQVKNGTATEVKSTSKNKDNNNTTTIIIIAVALIGFIALVFFARDTKEDEEKVEEVKEEVVIVDEPKEVVKATAKKASNEKATAAKKMTTSKPATKKTTTAKKSTTTKKTITKKTTNSTKTAAAKKSATTKKPAAKTTKK